MGPPRCASPPDVQPGIPYLQQLHLAEGGPLQTQPCAHLAHPAGQQEQQPVGETKKKKNQGHSPEVSGWGSGSLTVLETSHVFVLFPFSSIPILDSVFQGGCAARAGTGQAGGECGTPRGSPSPSLCKPSMHTALLWMTASGAPRRNPSAGFPHPGIPLC